MYSFDNVHHGILLEEIRKRVTDRRVLRLIKSFLTAGVIKRMGTFQKTITGTPQGGILSPLLANIYLNRLDQHFHARWQGYGSHMSRTRRRRKGLETCKLVRFADDFVLLVKGTREQAESLKEQTARFLKEHLRMELSWEKTRVTGITEGFDFLGHHIVLKGDRQGRWAVRTYPSKKSLRSVQEKVKKITSKSMTGHSLTDILGQLNPVLRGWSYYFRFDQSKKTFVYLQQYAWRRVYGWMKKKHRKLPMRRLKRKFFPDWTFQEDGITLFKPARVGVVRYVYRGERIPTPWNELADILVRRHRGDRLMEEPYLLESLQLRCVS